MLQSSLADTLDADLRPLRHPLVRDIAWLLHAPDLLTTPFPGRPSLSELGLANGERRRTWLANLERSPQTLETMAGPSLSGRLGIYHEKLWHFLLTYAPATCLLAHNLPVRDGKRTLGEIDLLYVTRDDPQPVHLELAIKYYLGLPQGPGRLDSQARWIGPGCADSLAIKRQRSIASQLPLSRRPEAIAALSRFTDQAPQQRLAMPGILFQPEETLLPSPFEAGPQACFGTWLPVSRWADFCLRNTAPDWRGALLDKPHWLAPPVDSSLCDMTTLTRQLEERFAWCRTPCQLALRQADAPWLRIFVVGDDWPQSIPLPC